MYFITVLKSYNTNEFLQPKVYLDCIRCEGSQKIAGIRDLEMVYPHTAACESDAPFFQYDHTVDPWL